MGESEYTVKNTQHTVTGSGKVQLIGPDTRRVSLAITPGNSTASLIAVAFGWPGGDVPFPSQTNSYLEFHCKDWGPLVAGAWGIDGAMAGGTVWTCELLLLSR